MASPSDRKILGYIGVGYYAANINVQINLVVPCQNTCWCCFAEAGFTDSAAVRSVQEAKERLKQLAERITSVSRPEELEVNIVISGTGEPSIRRKVVIELLDFIRQKLPYASPQTVTNGQVSFQKLMPALPRRLDELSISVHGAECSHIAVTRNRHAFTNVMRSLRELRQSRIRPLVSTLLTRELLGHEKEYCAVLEPAELYRASRFLSIRHVSGEKNLGKPSPIEVGLLLRRFYYFRHQQHAQAFDAETDTELPACVLQLPSRLPVFPTSPVQQYLQQFFLRCCEDCVGRPSCRGISRSLLLWRSTDGLEREIQQLTTASFEANAARSLVPRPITCWCENLPRPTRDFIRLLKSSQFEPSMLELSELVMLRDLTRAGVIFKSMFEQYTTPEWNEDLKTRCTACQSPCALHPDLRIASIPSLARRKTELLAAAYTQLSAAKIRRLRERLHELPESAEIQRLRDQKLDVVGV